MANCAPILRVIALICVCGRLVSCATLDPCVLVQCTREYEPVCGTDGQTYANLCRLQQAACVDPSIEYRGKGPCSQPSKLEQEHTQKPLPDNNALPTEDPHPSSIPPGPPLTTPPAVSSTPVRPSGCRRACPRHLAYVCGSDGRTYPTVCHMQNENCGNTGEFIYLLHHGPCVTQGFPIPYIVDLKPCNQPCPFSYVPVCGTDGKTYGNECVFQVANCKARGILDIDYKGRCSSRSNSVPAVVNDCPLFCDDVYNPVCASDGRTYDSLCSFNVVNCRSGGFMNVRHSGECEGERHVNSILY